MILDSEEQKTLLLNLIKSSQFAGAFLDEIYELRESVVNAKIKENKMIPTRKEDEILSAK